jgi:hypothetical protein
MRFSLIPNAGVGKWTSLLILLCAPARGMLICFSAFEPEGGSVWSSREDASKEHLLSFRHVRNTLIFVEQVIATGDNRMAKLSEKTRQITFGSTPVTEGTLPAWRAALRELSHMEYSVALALDSTWWSSGPIDPAEVDEDRSAEELAEKLRNVAASFKQDGTLGPDAMDALRKQWSKMEAEASARVPPHIHAIGIRRWETLSNRVSLIIQIHVNECLKHQEHFDLPPYARFSLLLKHLEALFPK